MSKQETREGKNKEQYGLIDVEGGEMREEREPPSAPQDPAS